MKFIPHEYQRYAIERVIEQPTIGLFLEMGLGKTVITLSAIKLLLDELFAVNRVLVIAPLRVAQTVWASEAAKWSHLRALRVSRVLGTEQQRAAALETEADIYVINRENVCWLVERCGRTWPFDMVVIDELSSFKDASAKRFRALRRVRPKIKRIVGLTGTPAPNGLLDLWAQVYLLDRGERLGEKLKGYRERYFVEGRRNAQIVFDWVPKPEAPAAIFKLLADLCVSMRSEDYLSLPDRIDRIVPVTLDDRARAAYDRLEREAVLPLRDGVITAATAAVVTGKLLQLANGAVYDEDRRAHEIHRAKLDALAELVEAANGQSVLVYYAFKHDLERIRQTLKGYEPCVLGGNNAEKVVADWNKGRIRVLLAHPDSAGHGLNLQDGGCVVVWFGLTWSLEKYQQANARLHRQGQRRPVIVHHLVAENTMDEQVMRVLAGKDEGQSALIDAVKARIERND